MISYVGLFQSPCWERYICISSCMNCFMAEKQIENHITYPSLSRIGKLQVIQSSLFFHFSFVLYITNSPWCKKLYDFIYWIVSNSSRERYIYISFYLNWFMARKQAENHIVCPLLSRAEIHSSLFFHFPFVLFIINTLWC